MYLLWKKVILKLLNIVLVGANVLMSMFLGCHHLGAVCAHRVFKSVFHSRRVSRLGVGNVYSFYHTLGS